MRRLAMVLAVRGGEGLRSVARRFMVSVSTVNHWVEHARGKRLARVNFGHVNGVSMGSWVNKKF